MTFRRLVDGLRQKRNLFAALDGARVVQPPRCSEISS